MVIKKSIRNVNNLSDFTLKIKSWIPDLIVVLITYVGLIYVK